MTDDTISRVARLRSSEIVDNTVNPYPARSVVQVEDRPMDIDVEIEIVASVRRNS